MPNPKRLTDDDLVDDWVVEDRGEELDEGKEADAVGEVPQISSKKRQRLQALKQKSKKRRKELIGQIPTASVDSMPVDAQVEYFWGNIGPYLTGLTAMELGEVKPDANDFSAPDGFSKHTDKELPRFVRALVPDHNALFAGGKKQTKTGIRVLIVCPSAARSTELLRCVKQSFNCKVAKLFAKHMKVKEQQALLQSKSFFPIAIGTPNRLNKLAEIGALSLTDTNIVIMDCARDVKNYNLLELKDTAQDMAALYHRHICRSTVGESSTSRPQLALW